jgi:hypothetical protein
MSSPTIFWAHLPPSRNHIVVNKKSSNHWNWL